MRPLRADDEARRLLWRCRRGLKELDLLLEGFARATLATASSEQRRQLARLLELPDPQLAAYLLAGERPADSELQALIERIQDYVDRGAGRGYSEKPATGPPTC